MAAEPWVFLRGLGRERGHWENFPENFGGHLNCAVICLDLPGSGSQCLESSPLSIEETMEKLREAAPLGAKYLFAISLGGMVAVEWARRHPEEIKGLVLINSSLRTFSPLTQRLSLKAWPWLVSTSFTSDIRARERRILEFTAPSVTITPDQLSKRVELFERHPMRRKNFLRQLWAASRYHPPLEAPHVPILILYSEQDRLVDPRCSLKMAKSWKASIHPHPTAGHDLPLEDPDWCCRAVKDWLSNRS